MALWSLVSRAVQFDFLLKAAFDAKAGAFFFFFLKKLFSYSTFQPP